MKRLISFMMIIFVLISLLPSSVFATEYMQNDIENTNVTVTSTNDFGDLFSQAVSESQNEAIENTGYSVIGLEIEGNVATVNYNSLEPFNLVVAIYTEDGLRLVASGTAEITADESEATVYIDGDVPEFFIASAYMLDCFDQSPLCVSYDTQLYTQEMQELLNSTVDDYDAERVLNLDEDDTTNFAVFTDEVVLVEATEDNIVVVEDEENNTYIIQNANESIISLAEGDVFAYTHNADVLIAKIGSISVDGTTVTIVKDNVEIEEVFAAVKVESESDTDDITIDTSSAAKEIIYTGLGEEASRTRAVSGDGGAKVFHEFKIGAKVDEDNGSINANAAIEGLLKIQMDVNVKWYVTLNKQYVEFKATPSINANIALKGSIGESIPLGIFTISPVPGVYVGFEPKFVCKFTGTVQLSATLTSTLGLRYDSSTGPINLSSTPKVEFDFKVEGNLFLGVDLAPKVTLLGDHVAKLSLSSTIGVQIKAKGTGSVYELQGENTEKQHSCQECMEIKPEFQAMLTGTIKFLDWDWLSVTIKFGEWTVPLGELYYSIDRNEFGPGICPYISYRITIVTMDSAKKAVSGAGVYQADGMLLGNTNANGVLIAYLSKGDYVFTTEIEENAVSAEVSVTKACKVVFNPDGVVATRLYADKITDYGAVSASGSCGNNLKWVLYNSGYMIISGTGPMKDYGISQYMPWYKYADSITAVVVQNGVTNVSRNAFSYCSNLTSAPNTSEIFANLTLTAYYPMNDSTWTAEVQKNMGGKTTWVAYEPETTATENDMISTFSVHGGDYKTEIFDDYTLKSASFSNLVPGAEYVLLALISVETENLLTADNMLFIQQKTAAADGTLVFQYIQRVEKDTSYVMACGATENDLCNATITFSEMYADSLVQAVDPIVNYNNEVLVEGCDYIVVGTVDYTKSGRYVCYVRGIGDYTGFVECSYIVNPKYTAELKFSGASLSLHHNLAVNYKVDKAVFENSGYADPYVRFELNGVTTTVKNYSVDDDRYIFTFHNIAPNQMNDTIYATLYATYDGVEYSGATREYSVAEYCYSMLDKYAADDYAELRTLLVDLLHYGSASQIYTDYNMEVLVDAALTETQLSWGTQEGPTMETVLNTAYETVENPTATWKGAALALNDAVSIQLKFVAESVDGLTVKIKTDTQEWAIPSDAFVEEDGVYTVYFNGLHAGQMRETLYLTVCSGENKVSNTACYSIGSYAHEKQNSTVPGLADLVKAMMKYGDSAYAYTH